jgi:hypothetical protein
MYIYTPWTNCISQPVYSNLGDRRYHKTIPQGRYELQFVNTFLKNLPRQGSILLNQFGRNFRIKPNLDKSKFVIMTLNGFNIP